MTCKFSRVDAKWKGSDHRRHDKKKRQCTSCKTFIKDSHVGDCNLKANGFFTTKKKIGGMQDYLTSIRQFLPSEDFKNKTLPILHVQSFAGVKTLV